MNRFIAVLVGFIVACMCAPVSAGPAEEVAQIAALRGQAFQDGNVDAYTAVFADNVVFQNSFSGYRIEGKAAVRAYFAELFLLYPRRHLFVRLPSTRVYNDDLVAQDGYAVLSVQNEKGETRMIDTRYSIIWAKTGGRWQIVDQHVSRPPVSP